MKHETYSAAGCVVQANTIVVAFFQLWQCQVDKAPPCTQLTSLSEVRIAGVGFRNGGGWYTPLAKSSPYISSE